MYLPSVVYNKPSPIPLPIDPKPITKNLTYYVKYLI